MSNTLNNRIIAIIIAIVFIFIVFYITGINDASIESELLKEYPYLKLSDSLNNRITSTYYPVDWRGATIFQCIALDNGKKYTISASTKERYNIEILKANMRILKKEDNDTIKVFDGKKAYIFIYFDNQE
jgi:uncharacterized membrane protein